jgi:Fe-S cluster assembly scaffold protein SufB
MPTLDEVKGDALFYMFKGEPGTRKSTQALSFPTPQYWFCHDKHMHSLVLPMKKWGVNAKDIHYDNYTDWAAMETKLKAFQEKCPYKTLIVDSITSQGDSINDQTTVMKGTQRTADNKEAAARKIGGIEVSSLEDYKAEAAAFRDTVAYLKDISSYHKVNVILIAHVVGSRPNEAENSSYFTRIVVTGGKVISAKIPAYCEEIYHFYVEPDVDTKKEGKYALITRNNGSDYARTGLPLPQKIEFGDAQLYERWVKPAITQLNNEKPVQKF